MNNADFTLPWWHGAVNKHIERNDIIMDRTASTMIVSYLTLEDLIFCASMDNLP
jgi:hypothetical protein